MQIIEINSLNHPGVEVFSTLTEAQLRNRLEPQKGIFIAESPKVIHVALNAGYEPLALLCERKHIEGDAVIRTNINPIEAPNPDFTDDDRENNIEEEEFADELPKKKRKPRKEKEKKEKKESNNGEGRLKNKVSNWFNSWFGVVDDDDESFN